MRIEVLKPNDLSPDHDAAWSRMAAAEALESPFLSAGWVRTLGLIQGPDRERLRVAVVHGPDGPEAFFAARVGRGAARPPGAPVCDYQGMIAAADLDLDPRALVSALGVGRLDFDKLLLRQARFAPFVRGVANAFVIDLRGGFEAYEADRRAAGSDILRDAAKKRRQLAREKGEVLFTPGSTDRAAFDQLIAWKRAQYRATGQTDIFEAGWPLELLKALLASEDPACRAQLFTLHAGGRLAAAHLALTGRTLAHAWFIAHDPDCGRWSPGSILIAEVARWAAEAGLAELDLGAGAYRFKTSFANQLRPAGHGFVGRPSAASLSRRAAYGARTLAEALPLGAASALPAKAMRRLDLVLSLR